MLERPEEVGVRLLLPVARPGRAVPARTHRQPGDANRPPASVHRPAAHEQGLRGLSSASRPIRRSSPPGRDSGTSPWGLQDRLSWRTRDQRPRQGRPPASRRDLEGTPVARQGGPNHRPRDGRDDRQGREAEGSGPEAEDRSGRGHRAHHHGGDGPEDDDR